MSSTGSYERKKGEMIERMGLTKKLRQRIGGGQSNNESNKLRAKRRKNRRQKQNGI
jgi:hypothetical protein